jgi:hypothetical protein
MVDSLPEREQFTTATITGEWPQCRRGSAIATTGRLTTGAHA